MMISKHELNLVEEAVRKSEEVCIHCGHLSNLHKQQYDPKTEKYGEWVCSKQGCKCHHNVLVVEN